MLVVFATLAYFITQVSTTLVKTLFVSDANARLKWRDHNLNGKESSQ